MRSMLYKSFAVFLLAVIMMGGIAGSVQKNAYIQIDVEQENVVAGTLPITVKTVQFALSEEERKSEFAKLAPTTTMTFEELVGDNGDYEDPAAYPAPDTFYVIVDITHQVVLVYKRDPSGAYTIPVRYMVCSTGASKTPTSRGIFKAGAHKVRFGLFVNNGVYGQYWTNMTRRIYFHSLLYTKRNANAYTTTSYKKLGSRASHGCIRLLVPDARFLYYHLAPGSIVEVRKGSKDDLVTAEIKKQLTRAKLPSKRPTLAKGEIPYTDNWSIDTYLNDYSKTVPAK